MVSPLELIKKLELGIAGIAEVSPKGMTPLEARDTVEALEQLRRSLTFTIEVWRANEVTILGAAGGSVMTAPNAKARVKDKVKELFDHDLIGRRVVLHACNEINEDGEIVYRVDDPEVAAQRAVASMQEIYVSPSTDAKKGALLRHGFETYKAALASSEVVGKQVVVRPT